MSVPFSAEEAVAWTARCGGRLACGDATRRFTSVSTDTRTLEGAAPLFVALVGERHDAHDHLEAALRQGAAGLLVSREVPPPGLPVIRVDDTTAGLGALAAGHRRGFHGPVVGITGSNGKTSTKELCAAMLGRSRPCLKNRGNWNNAIGLPLTLLQREADHAVLVVELGTNHPGEIEALAAIARPTVGIFTNVGTAHIEFLGSREGIAHEKGALLEALPADGVAVVNADDPLVMGQVARTRARVCRFGVHADADVRARDVESLGGQGFRFALETPAGSRSVATPGLGDHVVANALAAAAAALCAGAALDDVVAGLSVADAVPGRMQPHALDHQVTLLDDTYNASPQSVASALRSLARLRGGGRAIAVLGDMGELGAASDAAHREVGRLAAELGIDFVVAQGEHGERILEGARSGGLCEGHLFASRDPEESVARVVDVLDTGAWVLVKGSRAMKMERVVEALRTPQAERVASAPHASRGEG